MRHATVGHRSNAGVDPATAVSAISVTGFLLPPSLGGKAFFQSEIEATEAHAATERAKMLAGKLRNNATRQVREVASSSRNLRGNRLKKKKNVKSTGNCFERVAGEGAC
jgi:hypothetical protein